MYVILTTFVLMFMVYSNAFVNGKPHCNHFIKNVYLYLALSFSLCGVFIQIYNYLLNTKADRNQLLEKEKTLQQIQNYMMVTFIVSLVSIIMLSIRPIFSKTGYLLNHSLWLIFLASISFTLYPYFKSIEYASSLQRALIMTTLIFLCMTSIVGIIPNLIQSTYKKMMVALLFALIAIIITELYLIFTNQYTNDLYKSMSYVVIVVFSLFIVYDTSRLYAYSKQCVNSPNYPLLSTGLFLDIINIFSRWMNIKA
jgi:FtsH-binding integral membrane protein